MKQITALLISVLLITACSKEDAAKDQIFLDVSYGSAPAQTMDVYLPANSNTSAKVIILIHGGAWTSGDKSASTQYVDTLRRRMPGYAVFNINYRLSANPVNLFPAQEMDVKSAVEFIYNNRGQYNISDKFILIGESAGAHLAMLYAYKYNTPVKVKAVASFFGPSDLTDMYNNPVNGDANISSALALAIGATPTSDASPYTNSSPVNFTSTGVPTILLHGGLDRLVSPSQSVLINSRLINESINTQYVLYPAKDHGYDWDSLTFFDAFNKVQSFIEANVQ